MITYSDKSSEADTRNVCIDDSQQEEYLTKDGRRKVRILDISKKFQRTFENKGSNVYESDIKKIRLKNEDIKI
jgi:hypothetical protein